MKSPDTKPTRADLVAVVAILQDVLGKLRGAASDRNPHRAEDLERLTQFGLMLCIEARGYDAPQTGSSSPWAKVRAEIPNLLWTTD